eukprot:TRINITY_DN23911_c0_g1_i1.p1 TRINITY_DN23911_c0_g1~~TRINITY_DN23911_c0_g1_i1.p1  ORF type:complete len:167 (-),score=41.52 TRINITY_DN23911_c0_g1_i1:358-822(-)
MAGMTSSLVANAGVLSCSQSAFFGSSSLRLSTPEMAVRPLQSQSGRPGLTIMMGKRADDLIEIRSLSTEDINSKVLDLKAELFLLRAKQATRAEFKPSDFRDARKKIARMMTVKREREIEEGVGKRESRKLDKAWKRSIQNRPAPSYNAEALAK